MKKKQLNDIAIALNAVLEEDGCVVPELLSEKGKVAFFPHRGILGQSAEAKGTQINATIGTAFEDDGMPLCLECIKGMLSAPSRAFLYAPSSGVRDLRLKWHDMLALKNPTLMGQSYSLPVVTNALTHALFLAGQLFINPGEKLIIPDLYWDNYELLFGQNCGAIFSTFKTFEGKHFNVKSLARKLMTPGDKKILLLNFPNNPTGYTITVEEAKQIQAAILAAAEAGKKIVVLIDDAYFGLVYEKGIYKESIFSLLASLHKNVLAVKLDGPTKEDYVWGLRVGFITFGMKGLTPEQFSALENKAAGLVRSTISSASNIGQVMLMQAYGLSEYSAQKLQKFATLKARYDCIRKLLRSHKEYAASFTPMPFNSGYFMCIKPAVDAEVLRRKLISDYSTGTIMLSGLLRVAFSSVPIEKIPLLFENIHKAVSQLKGIRNV